MIIKAGRLMRAANKARLVTYLIALWKLFRHPQAPHSAKWVALAVLAYVVSPIDLIPDFIPVLGQLDDLVVLPLGIALVTRLTPAPLWEARLREAEAVRAKLPRLGWGALLVLLVWALMLALFVGWLVWLVAR